MSNVEQSKPLLEPTVEVETTKPTTAEEDKTTLVEKKQPCPLRKTKKYFYFFLGVTATLFVSYFAYRRFRKQ